MRMFFMRRINTIMSKLFKFPKERIEYSDRFFKKIDPKGITKFIKMNNPELSAKVAHAIALTLVYSTYAELVFDEEKIPQEIVDKVRNKDFKSFINNRNDRSLN